MKAFISYSHKDAGALDRLHTHLAMLHREGAIEAWFDREILAGGELDAEISAQLESCELFLLLISPDFLASDYCVEREMQSALERHAAKNARVVPIIIEPCDWTASPLRQLKALPRDAKPVSEWTNENNAYLDVVNEIRRILRSDCLSDGPIASDPATEGGAATRRYRVKRDFDEIDRSDFRSTAFQSLRSYFERAIVEIDSIDALRGRFVPLTETSFTCTLVNKARDRSVAHITVHCRGSSHGFSDIFYSFIENAADNTANGGFSIKADEYELYLAPMMFGSGRDDERLTAEGAAETLWAEFLQHAGVTYD